MTQDVSVPLPSQSVVDHDHVPEFPRLEDPAISFFASILLPSPTLVLKLDVDSGEADMMNLVSRRTSVRVPAVHEVGKYATPSNRRPYQIGITMDRVHGQPLSDIWTSLSSETQTALKLELASILTELRKPRFSVTGRPGGNPCIFNQRMKPVSCVPCEREDAWNLTRVKSAREVEGADESAVVRAQELLKRSGHGHRFVLTHCDLSDRNIMVDPTGSHIVAVIDWEQANVMPDYFEYVATRLSGGHQPYWRDVLIEVMEHVEGLAGSEQMEDLVDAERIIQGYSDACWWTFLGKTGPDPVLGAKLSALFSRMWNWITLGY